MPSHLILLKKTNFTHITNHFFADITFFITQAVCVVKSHILLQNSYKITRSRIHSSVVNSIWYNLEFCKGFMELYGTNDIYVRKTERGSLKSSSRISRLTQSLSFHWSGIITKIFFNHTFTYLFLFLFFYILYAFDITFDFVIPAKKKFTVQKHFRNK